MSSCLHSTVKSKVKVVVLLNIEIDCTLDTKKWWERRLDTERRRRRRRS
jgi:hypothetical protein